LADPLGQLRVRQLRGLAQIAKLNREALPPHIRTDHRISLHMGNF
jgi:hypothetical protein